MCCYYKILGIGKNATRTEIRNAYLKSVKQWHPDKNRLNSDQATNMLKKINGAYGVLSKDELRKRYDMENFRHSTNTKSTGNTSNSWSSSENFRSNEFKYYDYYNNQTKSERADETVSYKSWNDSKQKAKEPYRYQPSFLESLLMAFGIRVAYSISRTNIQIHNGKAVTTEIRKYSNGDVEEKKIIANQTTGEVIVERWLNGKFHSTKVIIPPYIKR